MKNYKIYIPEEYREQAATKADRLGYDGGVIIRRLNYHLFFFNKYGTVTHCSNNYEYFAKHTNSQIMIEDFLAFEEPKREHPVVGELHLFRDADNGEWIAGRLSLIDYYDAPFIFKCATTYIFAQCAPYKGNESKLGTTEDIPGKWTKEDL